MSATFYKKFHWRGDDKYLIKLGKLYGEIDMNEWALMTAPHVRYCLGEHVVCPHMSEQTPILKSLLLNETDVKDENEGCRSEARALNPV